MTAPERAMTRPETQSDAANTAASPAHDDDHQLADGTTGHDNDLEQRVEAREFTCRCRSRGGRHLQLLPVTCSTAAAT